MRHALRVVTPNPRPNPRRAEIWDVLLDPVQGSEMGGHREGETRPVLVLSLASKGRATMRVCVPLTNFQDIHLTRPWMVVLVPDNSNGLSKVSSADTAQIRALDVERFKSKRGVVGKVETRAIFSALGACLGFDLAPDESQEP